MNEIMQFLIGTVQATDHSGQEFKTAHAYLELKWYNCNKEF